MSGAPAIDEYGLTQLVKANDELRAEELALWREMAALQSAGNSYAKQSAAIYESFALSSVA